MEDTKPFELNSRLRCAYCIGASVKHPRVLRVPLMYNDRNPLTGDYWCDACDFAATAVRKAWVAYSATALDMDGHLDDESFVEAWHLSRAAMDEMEAEQVAAAQPDVPEC